MEVIVMEVEVEERSTVKAGVIRSCVSPLASDGLDEAFSLAIGLGAVRFCEEMLEAELLAGGGKKLGTVSGTTIGEEALDVDAMIGIEADGLEESVEDGGSLFIREEAGEGETGMVVNGDVQGLDTGARVAMSSVPCGADSWALETAQLLDVEVEEIAWSIAFVAQGGRFWRFQGGEAIEVMAAQHAGERGLGNGEDHPDLGIGTALPAQVEDLSFQQRTGLAGLMFWGAGTILHSRGEPFVLCAAQPFADSLFRDAESSSSGAQRQGFGRQRSDHFGSHERGESGVSVHNVRGVWKGVEYSSTTTLSYLPRADNVLKHDT